MKSSEPDENIEILNDDKIEGIPPTKWRVVWRKSSLPGIIVSECGDVWDSVKGRHPALYKLDHGCLVIVVKDGETFKREYVSKLVYEAFFGPLQSGMIVAHRDGINTNDDINNLFAMSTEQTNGKPIHVYKDGKVVKTYSSAADYASSIGVSVTTVQRFLKGDNKSSSVIPDVIGYVDSEDKRKPVREMPIRVDGNQKKRPGNRGRAVEVVRDGIVIKTFPTVRDCAKAMNMSAMTIKRRLDGHGPENPYKKIDVIRYAERKVKK